MGLDNVYGTGSLRSGVCTSTTRPASPYEGQTIYETDTDLVKSWDGSSWITIGPYTPTATVQMGYSHVDTSQTITSTAYQDLATIQSITLTTGNKAMISVGCQFTRPSPETSWWMSCAVSGATTIAASDARAAAGYSYSISGATLAKSWVVDLNPGTNTFTAKFRRDSTNANAYNRVLSVVTL